MRHCKAISCRPVCAQQTPGQATSAQKVELFTGVLGSLADFFLGKEANQPTL